MSRNSRLILCPSDLSFLWSECRRCFYLKVKHGLARPQVAFPAIFTKIDQAMKEAFAGEQAVMISPSLPAGVLVTGDRWVESIDINLPGRSSICIIRGKIDSYVEFTDGTYAIIDFKTSLPSLQAQENYSRQLHAYAWALENAAAGRFSLHPITHLGLLTFEPETFTNGTTHGSLNGGIQWIEIVRDNDAFISFLDEVFAVLDQSTPPPSSADCSFCKYRSLSRMVAM